MEDILYHMDTLLCPGARNEASLRLMCQCYELLGSTPSPALFLLGLGMGLGAVLWYGRAGTDWLAHLCNGLRTYLPPPKQGLACLWNTVSVPESLGYAHALQSWTVGSEQPGLFCLGRRIDFNLCGHWITQPLPQKQGLAVLKARCGIWSGG